MITMMTMLTLITMMRKNFNNEYLIKKKRSCKNDNYILIIIKLITKN